MEERTSRVIQQPEPPIPESTSEVKKETTKQPKRELSMVERQKRKKMVVMPLLFLLFAGAMWLIFAPSNDGQEETEGLTGFNAELPIPKDDGIVDNKREAYQREAMQQKEKEKMKSLQDFSSMFDDAEQNNYEQTESPYNTSLQVEKSRNSTSNSIQS